MTHANLMVLKSIRISKTKQQASNYPNVHFTKTYNKYDNEPMSFYNENMKVESLKGCKIPILIGQKLLHNIIIGVE